MPQLNPSPWLLVFLTIWTILVLLFMPKLLNASPPKESPPLQHQESTPPWTWPWF